MIDRRHKLSVSRQASLLGISRGAVYYLPKPIGESDLRIMHAMDRLHLDFPFMGSRLLTRMLRQQGYRVGRLHVRTLMIKMGISAIAPQPGTVSTASIALTNGINANQPRRWVAEW